MTDIFGDMIVGHVVEAHGARWACIKRLSDDLDSGLRHYLASKVGDPLPAATFVVAEEIDAAELRVLRERRFKHEAQLAAFRTRSKKP